MNGIANSTITMWVDPKKLGDFLNVLKILDGLSMDSLDKYEWDIHNIPLSKIANSNYNQLNLEVGLYMKFSVSYHLMVKKLGS